jgi:hypothetical protein
MLSIIRVRVAGSLAVAAALAGCGNAAGPVGGPAHSASARVPASAATASCDKDPWRSGGVVVTHDVSAPPLPMITAVRVAQHPECGYDRIVLDVRGRIPGYSVQYVQHVIADASGEVITMPGTRFLVITVRPAQAHSDTGVPTIAVGVQAPAYPALASWVLAGDFEGVVKIALGLSGPASVRTGELPGHIYVDVRE